MRTARLDIAGLVVAVTFKNIKHIYLRVPDPQGPVQVSAPRWATRAHIAEAVTARLSWITQQRARPPKTAPGLNDGDTVLVWGQQCTVEVWERPGRGRVEQSGSVLRLGVPAGSDLDQRRRVLHQWQRAELTARLAGLLAEWQPRFARQVKQWGIRRMTSRWGSCNPTAARLWFSLELATRHLDCVEYVVVHELAHLIERGHGPRFRALLDLHLPDWRARRTRLREG